MAFRDRVQLGLQPPLFKSLLKERKKDRPLPRNPTNVLSARRKCLRMILSVQFKGPPECLATGETDNEVRRGEACQSDSPSVRPKLGSGRLSVPAAAERDRFIFYLSSFIIISAKL